MKEQNQFILQDGETAFRKREIISIHDEIMYKIQNIWEMTDVETFVITEAIRTQRVL